MAIERYENGERKFDLPPEFRLPYNLPQVREAIEQGKTIYFVEGESDADALTANDYTATCVPFGAGGWNKRYVEHFKGAIICFIPDNDKTGKELPLKAIPDLLSVAKEVKVIELSMQRT
jgi:DNA primase